MVRPVTSTGDKGIVCVLRVGRRSPVLPAAWAPGLRYAWGGECGHLLALL